MANIINIETSASRCSVALGIEGESVEFFEDNSGHAHARLLAPFVKDALDALARRGLKLDAVAVSMGPGSYTGLRIGLSLAKGLCFSEDVPLIAIPTLELLAVKGMFANRDFDGTELLVPMIDARRMEVYTSAYDFRLMEVLPARPMILSRESFSHLTADRKLVFIGDGSSKAKDVLECAPESIWLSTSAPDASVMCIMAEKRFRERDFADVAYSVPVYLKEYEAKQSVNKVLKK